MLKGNTVIILALIILIAGGLRLYGVDRQSLWYDEVFEESVSQQLFSNNNIWEKENKIDNRWLTPFHLLFIYPMTKIFPGSDFALRMIPFIFGLITVPLFFIFSCKLFNEKVGLIAAFLLAISPFHIWHSQDARMYALLWMLALISLIYFIRILEEPIWKNYVVYVLSTVAALYTHQLTIFLILLQGLYILLFWQKYKKQLLKWLSVVTVLVLLFLPLVILSWNTVLNKQFGFHRETELIAIPYTLYTYSAGYSIGPSITEIHVDSSLSTIKPYFFEIGILMFIYIVFFLLGAWSISKDGKKKLILLLLIFIVPISGVFCLSIIKPNIQYSVRHTGIAFFGYLVFIAKGIDFISSLKSKKLGIVTLIFALILIGGFSMYSYANYQFDKKYQKEDIRGAVAYIKEQRTDGDVVLCLDDFLFNRYSGSDFQCSGFPISVKNNNVMVDNEMLRVLNEKKRLWLVLHREWSAYQIVHGLKMWLDTNYEEIKYLHKGINDIANVHIYCYDLTKKRKIN